MATPKTDENAASIDNYPPLRDWMREHARSCLWSTRTGKDNNSQLVEAWLAGKGVVIITVHPFKRGWDVYTVLNENSAALTLRDAEHRLGIETPPAKPEDPDAPIGVMAGDW